MCFTKLTKSDIFFVIYILLILHLGSICGSAILTLCDRSIPTSLVMPAFWIKTEGLRNIHELRLRVNRGFTLLHSLLCHVTWLYIVHFIIFRWWTAEPLIILSWNVRTPIFLQYCLPALLIHCLVLRVLSNICLTLLHTLRSVFGMGMNVFIQIFPRMRRTNLFILYPGILVIIG